MKTVELKVHPNQDIEVWDKATLLETMSTCTSPSEGLELLKKINQAKDQNGNGIYKNYKWGDSYLWGMHLEKMFSAYCLPFATYKPLLEYLERNQFQVGSIKGNDTSALRNILIFCHFLETSKLENLLVTKITKVITSFVKKIIIQAITIAAFCKIRRIKAKIGLFSYDTVWSPKGYDRRLKDVYEHFFSKKIPFIEIFYTPRFIDLGHLWKRKRIPLYFPTIQSEAHSFCFNYVILNLDKLEQRFALNVISEVENWIHTDQQLIPLLIKRLKRSGLQTIYSIDDAWFTTPLIVACKSLHLKLIALQHGYYNKYHQGRLQTGLPKEFTIGFPEIYVWGESSKDFLLNHGQAYCADQITITGYMRPLRLTSRLPKAPTQEFHLLYPYEFQADMKQTKNYIEAFLNKNYIIHFKVRWDDPIDKQLHGLPRKQMKLVYEINKENLDLFDVCAGSSTSFLHEMYYLGIPLWYLESSANYHEELVEDGLATNVNLLMLNSDRFNPYNHMIQPHKRDRLYAQGYMMDHLNNL